MDFEHIELKKKERILKALSSIYLRSESEDKKTGFFVEESSREYECVKTRVRIDEALSRLSKKNADYLKAQYFKKGQQVNKTLDIDDKTMIIDTFLHCLYG